MKNWLKKLKLSESTISTTLGALVVIVVGVLIFNYFSRGVREEGVGPEEMGEVEVQVEGKKELPASHKVKTGEHLWAIAVNYYDDGYQWPEIAKANNLVNPNIISPDQELTIPKVEVVEEEIEPITSEKYIVQKGDCLWYIALRAYGDPYRWPEIARVNNLVNPDLIHQGNEFTLPR